MAELMRRPSAFPIESELSLSQTDEIRLRREARAVGRAGRAVERISSREKKRRIWTIYFLGFMDLFGVSIMIPLLPRLSRNLGASPTLAGLIGSLYGALQVFSSPVLGKLGDLYGRKVILLLSYAGPAVGYFTLGLAGSLLMLAMSRIPSGILKHGLSTSKAYLADITDSEERRSVLGMFNACSAVGFIVGPLIGGYLADWDPSLQLSMLSGASVFLLNFFLALVLVPAVHKQDGSREIEREGERVGNKRDGSKGMDSEGERVGNKRDGSKGMDSEGERVGNKRDGSKGMDREGEKVRDKRDRSKEKESESRNRSGYKGGSSREGGKDREAAGVGESEREKEASSDVQQTQLLGSVFDFKQLVSSINIFKGTHWKELIDLILLRFLLTFAVIIFRRNFSVFLEEHFQVDYKTLGKITSFNGVAGVLAATTCGRISKLYSSHSKQLVHFSILLALSIFLITSSPNVMLVVISLVPLAISTANLRICMLSLMLQRGREDEKGAIIGLMNSISSFSRMLAPSVAGLAQEFSSETAGYIGSALGLLAVVVMVVYPIKRDSEPIKLKQE